MAGETLQKSRSTMSIFKITVKPIVKTRDWVIMKVKAGRKEKICGICKRIIKIGEPAMTFLKRGSLGPKQSYNTRYSCIGICHNKLAEKIHKESQDEKLANNTDTPTDAGSL